ncbi:MAG: cytochrome b [Hyphomicrobium sp.]|jgi:cytochrome b561
MIKNTQDAYGWPAITLHWIVALLIVGTFGLGLWMGEVPARADRPYYYAIHASLGITLLVILVLRILWALLNRAPAAVAGTPPWQHAAARFTHLALYALTLVTVLFGWFLASLQDTPIIPLVFGLVPLSAPLQLPHSAEDFLEEAHEIAAFALIAVAGLHVIAALWHHYVRRDDTLRRMLGTGAQPSI